MSHVSPRQSEPEASTSMAAASTVLVDDNEGGGEKIELNVENSLTEIKEKVSDSINFLFRTSQLYSQNVASRLYAFWC